jgi:hypothetical protein
LLPDIIQQLGPKQQKALMEIVAKTQPANEEIPSLVETKPDNLDKV